MGWEIMAISHSPNSNSNYVGLLRYLPLEPWDCHLNTPTEVHLILSERFVNLQNFFIPAVIKTLYTFLCIQV